MCQLHKKHIFTGFESVNGFNQWFCRVDCKYNLLFSFRLLWNVAELLKIIRLDQQSTFGQTTCTMSKRVFFILSTLFLNVHLFSFSI